MRDELTDYAQRRRWYSPEVLLIGVACAAAVFAVAGGVVLAVAGPPDASSASDRTPRAASGSLDRRTAATPATAPSASPHDYVEREALASLRDWTPQYDATRWPDERVYAALRAACRPTSTPAALAATGLPADYALKITVIARSELCPTVFPTRGSPPA